MDAFTCACADGFEGDVCDVEVPNMAPVAVNDPGINITSQAGTVIIDVLANDSDPDGSLDPSSVTITTTFLNLVLNGIDPATGKITVTAFPGAIGGTSEELRYTVLDDDGAVSNEATVTVNFAFCLTLRRRAQRARAPPRRDPRRPPASLPTEPGARVPVEPRGLEPAEVRAVAGARHDRVDVVHHHLAGAGGQEPIASLGDAWSAATRPGPSTPSTA